MPASSKNSKGGSELKIENDGWIPAKGARQRKPISSSHGGAQDIQVPTHNKLPSQNGQPGNGHTAMANSSGTKSSKKRAKPKAGQTPTTGQLDPASRADSSFSAASTTVQPTLASQPRSSVSASSAKEATSHSAKHSATTTAPGSDPKHTEKIGYKAAHPATHAATTTALRSGPRHADNFGYKDKVSWADLVLLCGVIVFMAAILVAGIIELINIMDLDISTPSDLI
eukprot:gene13108-3644_t